MSTAQMHMEQYLKTACPKGHLVCDWDFLSRRMTIRCLECHSTLIVDKPEDDYELRYDVQEFVKLHGPRQCALTPVPSAAPDKSWGVQQIISDAIKKYQQGIAGKMEDDTLAKKIAGLQIVTPEQKTAFDAEQKAVEQAKINAQAVQLLKLAENKQKALKLQQDEMLAELELKKKFLQAQLVTLTKEVEKKSAPPKALESKTGRKFR